MLARQLVERPEVLVLEEPTQGVDVGAKEEIHRIIADLADEGTAVLVVTSDLPEVLELADRVLVVRGRVRSWPSSAGAPRQADVLAAAAGAETGEGTALRRGPRRRRRGGGDRMTAVATHRPRPADHRHRPSRARS